MLTDIQCRRAAPKESEYKLTDGQGLFMLVKKTGFRSWRFKYRFAGKEKLLTFGPYPEVTLQRARELRDEARAQVRDGVDPSVTKKQRSAEISIAADTTFRAVATCWHRLQERLWKPRYAQQVLARLESDVFPIIGSMPIDSVTPALMLQVVRRIEEREAHEMAHRVRQHVSDVFVFAIGSGLVEDDPAHVIRKALARTTPRLRPAVTKIAAARRALAAIEQVNAYAVTKLASRLLALTAARPGVVRLAAPAEFEGLNGAHPIWRIPAEKMKLTRERRIDATYEFIIPLSRQAVEVVKEALELAGPKAVLLFPSIKHAHRPMSDNTLSKLYRDAGLRGQHVPHGWRATFSTLMNELAAESDQADMRPIIDMMLAHIQEGVEAAYNRAAYMPRRRAIAQQWADMLMEGAAPISQLVEAQRGSSARNARARGHDRSVVRARHEAASQGVRRTARRA